MVRQWITPFKKQCFVVIGASINMSQIGMVMGIAAGLLPQLRAADSDIPIDDSSGSWIAALPGFAFIVGNVTIPTIMAKFGRIKANFVSIFFISSGWACLGLAQSIEWILLARILQGISVGMSSCLTPIMIGEYTSPRNRGAFAILMSLIMATGTLTVHVLGLYISWRLTALIIVIITLINLAIVAASPESPSWLAEQGKHEECKAVFEWLRGEESEELNKLIQASVAASQHRVTQYSMNGKIKGYISIMTKKEFYKPIIIMAHLFTMGQWAGINLLAPYISDIATHTIGNDRNMALVVISVDIQRVLSCVVAVFIIRRFKRRTMLFVSCGVNALVLIVNAGYLYAKNNAMLPFDHPVIGGLLIHLLMITVAIGSLPLPYTIAGEIFSLKYRSLSSGISSTICSINIFLAVKTFPHLYARVGLPGAYLIYSGIVVYCLIVVWFLLPETKDRTLQEIENMFQGKVTDEDLKSSEQLRNLKIGDELVD